MTRRACIRVSCDAPACTADLQTPHDRSHQAEAHALAWGWTLVRWREAHPGARDDMGGGPRKLDLCPKHSGYRPAHGVVLSVTRMGRRLSAGPTQEAIVPLKPGSSKPTIEKNIRTEVAAGKDPKQAAAIAYDKARETKRPSGPSVPRKSK